MPAYHDSGFVVREPAWHGESTVLKDWPGTKEEARTLAGLDWEPVAMPAYYQVDTDLDGKPIYEEMPEYRRITRDDNLRITLAVTTDSYGTNLIPNAEMFECVEAFLRPSLAGTKVKFDTAGAAMQGAMVYVTVYLDEPWQAPGDSSPVYPYLVLLNRHDGKGAFKVAYVKLRVVCANTFNMADMQSEREGTGYSFRHTSNWREKVDEARNAINGARDDFQAFQELAVDLAAMKTTAMTRKEFVERFIPWPEGGEALISDRVRSNILEARGQWYGFLNGPTCEGVADTGWGLVQAAGEYLDHGRRYQNRGTYINRTLLRPEPLKGKAIKLAREVCGAAAS
jgi:phage/plasmid-like protein (TIGR03299 family)